MTTINRVQLRELLEAGLEGWHPVDNDSEYTLGLFNSLVSSGFARSRGGSITINGQWYPHTEFQITESGLDELGYEICPDCEGEGVEDYNFETETETPCPVCKGKGYAKQKPYNPCEEIQTQLAAVTAEMDALQIQLDMIGALSNSNGTEAARYQEALTAILDEVRKGIRFGNSCVDYYADNLTKRLEGIKQIIETALYPSE